MSRCEECGAPAAWSVDTLDGLGQRSLDERSACALHLGDLVDHMSALTGAAQFIVDRAPSG